MCASSRAGHHLGQVLGKKTFFFSSVLLLVACVSEKMEFKVDFGGSGKDSVVVFCPLLCREAEKRNAPRYLMSCIVADLISTEGGVRF